MRVLSNEIWNKLTPETREEIERLTPKPQAHILNKMKMNYPIVRDFNFILGTNCLSTDAETFFGNEEVTQLYRADIFDLLVRAGCFTSKNNARKNWKGIQKLPEGYFEIGPIGKAKVMIFGVNLMRDTPCTNPRCDSWGDCANPIHD